MQSTSKCRFCNLVTVGSTRIQSLFPPQVVTAEVDPTVVEEKILHPAEEALVSSAVPKRRREFAAGRACARAALAELGKAAGPILSGVRNEPRWPEGVIGSITHTNGYCAAAVASEDAIRSVGLDVERSDSMPRELWSYICTNEEFEWLSGWPQDDIGSLVKLIFCVKECVYKCQYPITHEFLDFLDVEIAFNNKQEGFVAKIVDKTHIKKQLGSSLEGRCFVDDGFVHSGMVLVRK